MNASAYFTNIVSADEEVAKFDAEVDVLVHVLLEGKLDVEANRDPTRLGRTAVGGLHHPGTAAGDHRQATPGQGLRRGRAAR